MKIHDGKMEEFHVIVQKFIDATRGEDGCMYYEFGYDGDEVHVRECYDNGDAALVHLGNVGALLQECATIADFTRLEVFGSEAEIAKLREPLAEFGAKFYTLESGIRR